VSGRVDRRKRLSHFARNGWTGAFACQPISLQLSGLGFSTEEIREATNLDDDALSYDDPVAVYIRELRTVPALSRDEEIDCVAHVLAGDQMAESAGKRLAEANLMLVVSIAERYQDDRNHILHLIQKGNLGLLRAVQTLSETSHDSFSAYAAVNIERAIREAGRGN
jgi:RNA polymerase primary sigma factor